jgi:hypothetical protein
VTLGGDTLTSRAAVLGVDVGPPVVLGAFGSADSNRVNVVFDEPVNPTNAVDLSHYSIGGLAISAARLAFPNTVILTTANQVPGTSYTLHVQGVMDLLGNVSSGVDVGFRGATLQMGGLRVDLWTNITGSSISDLTGSVHFARSSDFHTSGGVLGGFA